MNAHPTIRARLAAIATTLALTVGLSLVATSATADTMPTDPTSPTSPVTVAADALPTVQIDGVAWSQVVVGNTVYVAGKFTTARPAGAAPGVSTVERNNLLAYNIETGALVSSFNPNLNAQALAITASPDGSRIYVTGDFTTVGGAPYYRIAAFNTATGAVIPSFKPILGSQGRAISATNSTVYVGGTFRTVSGNPRDFFAAINADGTINPLTANADAVVDALTVTTDGSKVIVGGRFVNIAGSAIRGLAAVDATTGAILPFAVNQKVSNAGLEASITSLKATNDRIYGTGYVFGTGGNLEGTFSADPNTGAVYWIEDCHGDTYSSFAQGDAVYVASHSHYCGNIGAFPQTDPWTMHYGMAFSKQATCTITGPDPYNYFNWAGNPCPSLLNWFPKIQPGTFTGQGQAGWSVTGNDRYVVYGGEFPNVNGVGQQGLVRFAIPSIAPNKVAPIVNTELVPSIASFKTGTARISWTATYDYDNANLTYKLVRDGQINTPVYTQTVASNFYTRPQMGFVDTGMVPGSTHTYRLYVTDPYGNQISRLAPTVTVAAVDSGGPYEESVLASSPKTYWPLDEATGTVGFDHNGFVDVVAGDGVTRGAAGIVAGQTASTFNGTTTGIGVTPIAQPAPNNFTAEAWFKTTSTSGGKILGFGNASSGNSTNYDRHIYMDNSGRILFGVYTGSTRTVASSASFNNGQWHHVVAQLSSAGMKLYVDGLIVGLRTDVTAGEAINGYWRIGGDNLGGWTNQPSSNYFNGDIAQVAIYDTVIPRSEVLAHYSASGRTALLPPVPADAYGAAVYNLEPTLYWRLNETSGTVAADSGPLGFPGTYFGSINNRGQNGAISGTTNKAIRFSSNTSGIYSTTQFNNPTVYSLELWFLTNSNTGGKLIGFGNNRNTSSTNYDRHLYMQDDGRLVFGTYTGAENKITSPNAYKDNQWHQAIATQSSDGMKLYVDGVLVGTNPQTAAQDYAGYWRVAGDPTWGSSGQWFKGTLDEVAVYPFALTPANVSEHYFLGKGITPPNIAPVAQFSSNATYLDASFDSVGSTDPDGTISTYAWDFGDAATDTGPTAAHTYAATGTYHVTLTVTDDDGTSTTVAHDITVTENQAPTAEFTSSSTNLTAQFDSTTSDSDGTIVSRVWDFGDSTAGAGEAPTHSYATGGTYSVTLTVTDNAGKSTTVSHDVTVTPPPNVPPFATFSSGATYLNASFNSVGSMDPDGTISSYVWDFGDSTGDSGPSVSHIYAATGSYLVSLTVTDNLGTSTTISHTIAVTENQAPTAEFTSGSTNLTATFDATPSGDSDGSIVGRSWNFGDTHTGSGITPSHTYTSGGTYTVTLTVTDNGGKSTSVSHDVVVTAPVVPNVAPVGAFTVSALNLTASVDSAASTDSDGTIVSRSWNWGDSSTGTGVAPSHAYATGGTYTITLTLTDDDGDSSTVSHQVTVSAPPPPPAGLAVDDFTRTVNPGWGTATTGGAWTITGTTAFLRVDGSAGVMSIPAGSTRTASLNATQALNTDTQVSFTLDGVPTGGGAYTTIMARQSAATNYAVNAWVKSTGAVALVLKQGTTVLTTVTVPGLTYTPGLSLTMRFQVTGTNPTVLKARIWTTGTTEPTTWLATANDSTAALQSAGAPALQSAITASSTAPVVTRFDSFKVASTDVVVPPAPNMAPVGAFTVSALNLVASVDSAASTDSDGTIVSRSWNWGDATPAGSGVAPSHTYAAAGTYTITLTLTDDDGDSSTVSHPITVSAPPVVPNVAPVGAFTVSALNLTASVDSAASTDSDGTIVSRSWNWGDSSTGTGVAPSHAYATGGTYTITLTLTDDDGDSSTVSHQVTVSAPPPPPAGLAVDDFTRTVNPGWGTATTGGAWTITGTTAFLRVDGSAGVMSIPAGSTRTASLNATQALNTDTQVSFTLDGVPTGGGAYTTIMARQSAATNYAVNAWVKSTGAVALVLKQGTTVLTTVTVPGLTYTPGLSLTMRFQVTGTNPTVLKARIWTTGTTEPTTWLATANDSTAALQSAGAPALQSAITASSTAPVVTRFDSFLVQPQ